jgi:DNA repair exonuclease SbcCD ATPase subunit
MLKSYPTFKEYVDSIKSKAQQLRASLDDNQNAQDAAKQEFADAFGAHANTDPATKKLKSLKEVEGILKDQLDIIESTNFHKFDLANEIINQYQDADKALTEQLNSLWEQAESVRAAAEERVDQLREQYQSIQEHFINDLTPQALEAVRHLDMSSEAKDRLYKQIDRKTYVTPIPNARKYYGG